MLYPEMTTPEPLLSADLHPNLSNSSTQRIMLVHLHFAAHAIAMSHAQSRDVQDACKHWHLMVFGLGQKYVTAAWH